MTRLLLPLLSRLAVLFALAVAAIRVQPRDDAAVRALLAAPDGCVAPCFLGIRPGETNRAQTLAILSSHPLIDRINEDATGVSWRWNQPSPQLGSLLDGSPSEPIFARVDFYAGIVSSIHMETTIKWGDFLLLFGKPDQTAIQNVNAPSVRYHLFGAVYRDHDFEIQTMTRCPINSPEAMWYSTVYVIWPISGLLRSGQMGRSGSC